MAIGWYLAVSALIFTIGAAGVLTRRSPLVILLCLELMLNGLVLAAAAIWFFLAPRPTGEVLLLVVLAVMTLEMAMGFAVAVLVHRRRGSDMTDMAGDLAG